MPRCLICLSELNFYSDKILATAFDNLYKMYPGEVYVHVPTEDDYAISVKNKENNEYVCCPYSDYVCLLLDSSLDQWAISIKFFDVTLNYIPAARKILNEMF